MAATGVSRGVALRFLTGPLYHNDHFTPHGQDAARHCQALSRLDVDQLCGWYQVAAVEPPFFQRVSRDARSTPPQPAGRGWCEDSEAVGVVPRGEEYATLSPELYLRRTEVLSGRAFGGKELVTDAARCSAASRAVRVHSCKRDGAARRAMVGRELRGHIQRWWQG